MTKIAKVAVLTHLNRLFDYLLPQPAQPGVRVIAPFGRRKIVGVITDITENSQISTEKLKPIEKIIDQLPLFSPELIAFYQWQSHYYFFPMGEIFRYALPKKLNIEKPIQPQMNKMWQITEQGCDMLPKIRANALLQKKTLVTLKEQHDIEQDQLKHYEIELKTLKILQKKGYVRFYETPKSPVIISLTGEKKQLTDEQQNCVIAISTQLTKFSCTLLQGVTGSGKTEVYFSVIDQIVARKQQVLILVPEIGLTPQTVQRFKQRFGASVGVYHSNLNDTERYDTWVELFTGNLAILIGTRSAVFLPIPQLGLIIIDEEHDSSFKQQDRLRYSARDSAIKRAQLENIPIILGSATPSLESIHNAQQGRFQQLFLDKRANNANLPTVQLVDIRNQKLIEGFTQSTLKAIKIQLEDQQHVLVLINRRGFAPIFLCHHCGWVAKCNFCDANLTVHFSPLELQCHHCDARQSIPTHCPSCQKNDVGPFGHGTERCEEELKKQFPTTEIIRVDRDTIRKKQSMGNIVARMQQPKPIILVGTQLLAKGHDFATISLVVILNIDTGLFSADFRGTEKMAQLFLQTAGRAGRGKHPGTVLVQTHHPSHPLFNFLRQHDYKSAAKNLLTERREAGLPPFSFQALIRAESSKPEHAKQFLFELKKHIIHQAKHDGIELLGPVSALMEKRAGRYRANLLLQSKKRQLLLRLIANIHAKITKSNAKSVRCSIDIDPLDVV